MSANSAHSALLDQAFADQLVEVRLRDVQRVCGLLLELQRNGTLLGLALAGLLEQGQLDADDQALGRLRQVINDCSDRLLSPEMKLAIKRSSEARFKPQRAEDQS